jgi:hypothetical protein
MTDGFNEALATAAVISFCVLLIAGLAITIAATAAILAAIAVAGTVILWIIATLPGCLRAAFAVASRSRRVWFFRRVGICDGLRHQADLNRGGACAAAFFAFFIGQGDIFHCGEVSSRAGVSFSQDVLQVAFEEIFQITLCIGRFVLDAASIDLRRGMFWKDNRVFGANPRTCRAAGFAVFGILDGNTFVSVDFKDAEKAKIHALLAIGAAVIIDNRKPGDPGVVDPGVCIRRGWRARAGALFDAQRLQNGVGIHFAHIEDSGIFREFGTGQMEEPFYSATRASDDVQGIILIQGVEDLIFPGRQTTEIIDRLVWMPRRAQCGKHRLFDFVRDGLFMGALAKKYR